MGTFAVIFVPVFYCTIFMKYLKYPLQQYYQDTDVLLCVLAKLKYYSVVTAPNTNFLWLHFNEVCFQKTESPPYLFTWLSIVVFYFFPSRCNIWSKMGKIALFVKNNDPEAIFDFFCTKKIWTPDSLPH